MVQVVGPDALCWLGEPAHRVARFADETTARTRTEQILCSGVLVVLVGDGAGLAGEVPLSANEALLNAAHMLDIEPMLLDQLTHKLFRARGDVGPLCHCLCRGQERYPCACGASEAILGRSWGASLGKQSPVEASCLTGQCRVRDQPPCRCIMHCHAQSGPAKAMTSSYGLAQPVSIIGYKNVRPGYRNADPSSDEPCRLDASRRLHGCTIADGDITPLPPAVCPSWVISTSSPATPTVRYELLRSGPALPQRS